jgi:hypothetical protein
MNRDYKPQATDVIPETVRRIQEASDAKLRAMMAETAETIAGIVLNISQGRMNANVPASGGTFVTEHSLPYLSAWMSIAAKEWVWRMHESNQRMIRYALMD